MSSIRITITLTIAEAGPTGAAGSQPFPHRDANRKFWSEYSLRVPRQPGFSETPESAEAKLRKVFGTRLRERLLQRLGKPLDTLTGELLFRVTAIRYGSALVDLDLFGIGSLATLVGSNEDILIAMLEETAADAFIDSTVPGGLLSADEIGLSATVQSRDRAASGSRLWSAINKSYLVPVIMVLVIYYVAFLELHYEKARYLEQSKVLMDHYESEIKSLDSRLRESLLGVSHDFDKNKLDKPIVNF